MLNCFYPFFIVKTKPNIKTLNNIFMYIEIALEIGEDSSKLSFDSEYSNSTVEDKLFYLEVLQMALDIEFEKLEKENRLYNYGKN